MSTPRDHHKRTVNTLSQLPLQTIHNWVWEALENASDTECLVTIAIPKSQNNPTRHGIHVTVRPQDPLPNFPGVPPPQLHGLLPYIPKYEALRLLTESTLDTQLPAFQDAFGEHSSGWDTVKKSSFGDLAQTFADYVHGPDVLNLPNE